VISDVLVERNLTVDDNRFDRLASPVSTPSLEAPLDAPPPAPLRVLVAEDHADQRLLLQTALMLKGFSVDAASDGLEALRLAFSREFDVIVADIHLPGVIGIDLARFVECAPCPPAVVLVTGYPQWHELVADRTDLRILRKPFSIDELEAAVRNEASKRETAACGAGASKAASGAN